jgi:hypothetical protein
VSTSSTLIIQLLTDASMPFITIVYKNTFRNWSLTYVMFQENWILLIQNLNPLVGSIYIYFYNHSLSGNGRVFKIKTFLRLSRVINQIHHQNYWSDRQNPKIAFFSWLSSRCTTSSSLCYETNIIVKWTNFIAFIWPTDSLIWT